MTSRDLCLCLTEYREASVAGALGHQRGDVANLRGNDRRSGQNVTHCFRRLQTVARDAQYNLIIRMEVPRFGERECTSDGYTTGRLREHARRFRKQTDAFDERFVAHVLS